MKAWLQDKRPIYLERMLQMKAGPQMSSTMGPARPAVCSRCNVGRPVWRCLDCTDKSAVCVLCCRNTHQMNLFHRVEKWNGRHYQQGALWQVGVKIHTGHNGQPCHKSLSALSAWKLDVPAPQSIAGNVLEEVAAQFGKTQEEVLHLISDALPHPLHLMSAMEHAVLSVIAEKAGRTLPGLILHLKASVSLQAEQDAEDLQAGSDQAAAEDEGPRDELQQNDGLAIPLEEDIGADEDWEDEDERPARGHIPHFIPRPPPTDGAGNRFITVVHSNGFHALPIVWCACLEHLNDRDLQLLDLHLYPATADRISTVFTFACLDDHRYDYLECKSSRYPFHNKLRRQTNPLWPEAIPSRYTELGRVSRQWRNLKYRKWFWLLDNLNAKRGAMALFCAACPQDGINLPEDWKVLYAANP
jgi:hypothetical protein